MKSKLLYEDRTGAEGAGLRSFVVVLDIGDEVSAALTRFASDNSLSAAQVTAIGAMEKATLAYWNWDTKAYRDIPVDEQVEVLSLNGDIALQDDGSPKLHLHGVFGRSDGSVVGGHIKSGVVRPTLEVIVTEMPVHLRRRHDATTGLALIDLTR